MTFLRFVSAASVAVFVAGCPQPATGPRVPVYITSSGEPVEITVRTRVDDRLVSHCTTPCSREWPAGDYEIEAHATETAPSKTLGVRVKKPTDFVVEPGSSTGEDVGYAIALPSTVALPLVTVGTMFACVGDQGATTTWCTKRYGLWTILGLTGATIAGWVLAYESHTKIEPKPSRAIGPTAWADGRGAGAGWAFAF